MFKLKKKLTKKELVMHKLRSIHDWDETRLSDRYVTKRVCKICSATEEVPDIERAVQTTSSGWSSSVKSHYTATSTYASNVTVSGSGASGAGGSGAGGTGSSSYTFTTIPNNSDYGTISK